MQGTRLAPRETGILFALRDSARAHELVQARLRVRRPPASGHLPRGETVACGSRPLAQERDPPLSGRREVHGRERRWHGRLRGAPSPPRVPGARAAAGSARRLTCARSRPPPSPSVRGPGGAGSGPHLTDPRRLAGPSAARYTPPTVVTRRPTVMTRRLDGHQAVRRGQERAFSAARLPTQHKVARLAHFRVTAANQGGN
jgi:hypothetical protein